MTEQFTSTQLYLRLLRQVRPYWRTFAIALFSMAVLAATEPAIPALLKQLLDGSFVEKDVTSIQLMPLFLVLLFLVRGASDFASTVALAWVSNKVVMDLRAKMFHRILALPNRYFDDHASGTLVSKLTYDTTQVTSAATEALIVLVKDSLTVLGLLGWMLYLDWQLSLLFLTVLPAIGLVVKRVSKRLRRLNVSQQASMGSMTHVLHETINGNKEIKVFGAQDYEQARFGAVINSLRRYRMKAVVTSAANVPIVQLIAVLALAVIIYFASTQEITVGGFVSFFGAMALMLSPVKRLTKVNEHIQRGLAAAQSVFEVLDQDTETDTGRGTLERARGEIRFDDVGFQYPQAATPALEHVCLEIAPGETVALVGQSGSGKSTLVSLLPRFYEPSSGRITLDGIDIRELSLASLRDNLALVTQNVVLFNDTIAANIAYGAGDQAEREAVIAAARAAHVMEFVDKLPDGLDTLIGENGLRLSGGQRQRLSIARALMKDAPILLLDEATSALDTESERQVQAAIDNLKRGRTTIIVAHRLSTIVNADRIVVLQQGRIQEVGTHRELLSRAGAYRRLHQLQQAGA